MIGVKTGERVTVTPANYAASDSSFSDSRIVDRLARLEGLIKAMNKNLVMKEFNINVNSNIDGVRFVRNITRPAENRIVRKGQNLREL